MSHLPTDIHHRLISKWEPPENNQFMLKFGGKAYRCPCGCNVFHKDWSEEHGEYYQCNACDHAFQAE